MTFGFGEVGGTTTVGRVRDPVAFPVRSVRGERHGDGHLFAVFFADGEVVGVEGRVLPSLEMLQASPPGDA
jgi:hypothetical protein